jgi:hypothetical protein
VCEKGSGNALPWLMRFCAVVGEFTQESDNRDYALRNGKLKPVFCKAHVVIKAEERRAEQL